MRRNLEYENESSRKVDQKSRVIEENNLLERLPCLMTKDDGGERDHRKSLTFNILKYFAIKPDLAQVEHPEQYLAWSQRSV